AVDFLDALASDRQYRHALPLEQVMKRLSADAGKAFDPQVIAIIQRRCRNLEALIEKSSTKTGLKLSTEIKFANGAAPATGFESSSKAAGPAMNESTFL